ncbi:MAG: LysR substrate-binding domain-containing protein [Pseudomonadota bacterium]
MDKFTLKQLRYFAELAQEGHFGRAAARCAISQPALSIQIKELELTLGQALFERSARQVRLTTFGDAFLRRAQRILHAIDELDEFARSAQDPLAGPLRLGVIPTIAPYLLPKLITQLGKSYPAMDLQVRETLTPRLVKELLQAKLDLAIVALPVDEPSLVETQLFFEPLLLVRPEADAQEPIPAVGALREARLLLLEEGHCLRDQTVAFCGGSSATASDGLDGSSLSTLVQMVGAGMGVTLIPEMAREVESRLGRVSCATLAEPTLGRTVGMIWRRSSPLGSAFDQVAAVVRTVGLSISMQKRH